MWRNWPQIQKGVWENQLCLCDPANGVLLSIARVQGYSVEALNQANNLPLSPQATRLSELSDPISLRLAIGSMAGWKEIHNDGGPSGIPPGMEVNDNNYCALPRFEADLGLLFPVIAAMGVVVQRRYKRYLKVIIGSKPDSDDYLFPTAIQAAQALVLAHEDFVRNPAKSS